MIDINESVNTNFTKDDNERKKLKVAVIGALPPPFMGPTLATKVILNSDYLKERYSLFHVDTSDHRSLKTLGIFDITNLFLAVYSYFKLIICLLKFKPDIVYLQISQTTIGFLRDSFYIIVSNIFRRKIVLHLRGGQFRIWYDSCSKLMQWYVRAVYKKVSSQIVLGNNLKILFANILPSEKISVIPNGKDINFLNEKIDDGKVRILFAANLKESKGIRNVIRVIPRVLKKANFPVEFHILGDNVEESTSIWIDEYLSKRDYLPVTLHGKKTGEDKYNIFIQSDIFLFPTYYPPEGHPWVIIEAMAAGLPVISTDQGAIVESVINGENGIITSKFDLDIISEDLLSLINSPELRKTYGEKSKKMYNKSFMEKNMINGLINVFSKDDNN